MGLTSAIDGWALTETALATTRDGGKTWTDVTPPGTTASNLDTVFFLDDVRGWAAGLDSANSGQAVVHRTDDGGATWSSVQVALPTSPVDSYSLGDLDFVDSTQGWLPLDLGSTWITSRGDLLRSQDGGATWTEVSIPDSGAVRFIDPQIGFDIGGPGSPLSHFFRTSDSGNSWTSVALSPPVKSSANAGIHGPTVATYELPSFWDTQNGAMAVTLSGEIAGAAEAYVTHDAGASWTLGSIQPLPGPVEPGNGSPLETFGPQHWVAAFPGSGTISKTLDGGATWSTPSPSAERPQGVLDMVQFATATVGWQIAQLDTCASFKSDCSTTRTLFATSDGGVTWQELSPP